MECTCFSNTFLIDSYQQPTGLTEQARWTPLNILLNLNHGIGHVNNGEPEQGTLVNSAGQ